jgi:hypothetical protein
MASRERSRSSPRVCPTPWMRPWSIAMPTSVDTTLLVTEYTWCVSSGRLPECRSTTIRPLQVARPVAPSTGSLVDSICMPRMRLPPPAPCATRDAGTWTTAPPRRQRSRLSRRTQFGQLSSARQCRSRPRVGWDPHDLPCDGLASKKGEVPFSAAGATASVPLSGRRRPVPLAAHRRVAGSRCLRRSRRLRPPGCEPRQQLRPPVGTGHVVERRQTPARCGQQADRSSADERPVAGTAASALVRRPQADPVECLRPGRAVP